MMWFHHQPASSVAINSCLPASCCFLPPELDGVRLRDRSSRGAARDDPLCQSDPARPQPHRQMQNDLLLRASRLARSSSLAPHHLHTSSSSRMVFGLFGGGAEGFSLKVGSNLKDFEAASKEVDTHDGKKVASDSKPPLAHASCAAAHYPPACDAAAHDPAAMDAAQVVLASYIGSQPLVLFFYPKAETPGCTKQVRAGCAAGALRSLRPCCTTGQRWQLPSRLAGLQLQGLILHLRGRRRGCVWRQQRSVPPIPPCPLAPLLAPARPALPAQPARPRGWHGSCSPPTPPPRARWPLPACRQPRGQQQLRHEPQAALPAAERRRRGAAPGGLPHGRSLLWARAPCGSCCRAPPRPRAAAPSVQLFRVRSAAAGPGLAA